MQEELKPTELRLPEIKEYLYESFGKILELAGFRYKKTDFSFIRKRNTNTEKVFFLFYNYYPLDYEMHFLAEIWNNEIEAIKSGFRSDQQIEKFNFRSLVIFMGDLMEECKDLPIGLRKGHTSKLAISTDLVLVSKKLHALFQDKLIPLLDQLNSVDGLDEFFDNNPGWSAQSLNLNNICTDLVAAKITKRRNIAQVYKNIKYELGKSTTTSVQNLELIEVIDHFALYLDSIK